MVIAYPGDLHPAIDGGKMVPSLDQADVTKVHQVQTYQ